METFAGKCVLVTGASSGIGESFARALAARGASLVLVARSKHKLDELARAVAEEHGARGHVVASDLTLPGAADRVHGACAARGIAVDVLINNAGFATYGAFEELPLSRHREEVALNCAALVELTHAFLPRMVQMGSGGVINVASTAAFQPVPFMAVYGATKAFVLSFSEALWAENRSRGVRVLALCPGATETPFFDVVGAEEASVGPRRESPDVVVARALDAFARGRSYVITGRTNYLMANVGRVLPRAFVAAATGRIMRPRGRHSGKR